MENLRINKGWLPIFPGFYGTIFEVDESEEIYNINEERKENCLSPLEFDDFEFDYEKYNQEVSKYLAEQIGKYLVKNCFVSECNFESLYSPKQYNFSNDIINVDYKISEENHKNILTYLNDNLDAFKEYLKNRYTSCDGFISFHSNNVSDWLKSIELDDFYDDTHKLSDILNFICENEIAEDGYHEVGIYELYEEVSGNVFLEIKNYHDLVAKN